MHSKWPKSIFIHVYETQCELMFCTSNVCTEIINENSPTLFTTLKSMGGKKNTMFITGTPFRVGKLPRDQYLCNGPKIHMMKNESELNNSRKKMPEGRAVCRDEADSNTETCCGYKRQTANGGGSVVECYLSICPSPNRIFLRNGYAESCGSSNVNAASYPV